MGTADGAVAQLGERCNGIAEVRGSISNDVMEPVSPQKQPRAHAAPAYLDRPHPGIASRADLPSHRFVGYIEELLFTPELDYLPQVSPKISAKFRSANLIAQLNATIAGFGIAVLPHFMAVAHPESRPILPHEVSISRTFWLLMHADSKDLARIRAVADYIYETVECERALFNPPRIA